MDIINEKNRNIQFSLHDSRIRKIAYRDGTLTLQLDHLFQYTEDEEKIYSGEVVFNTCDLEDCSVWVFDRTVYRGEFSGKAFSMEEYMEKFSDAEFEIINRKLAGNIPGQYNALLCKGVHPGTRG